MGLNFVSQSSWQRDTWQSNVMKGYWESLRSWGEGMMSGEIFVPNWFEFLIKLSDIKVYLENRDLLHQRIRWGEIDSDTLPRNPNDCAPGAPGGADCSVSAFYNSLSSWRTTSCKIHFQLFSSPPGEIWISLLSLALTGLFLFSAVLMMMRGGSSALFENHWK